MRNMNLKVSALWAMAAGLSIGAANGAPLLRMPSPKRVRNYPMPVISSPEEIAAWNEAVTTRQVVRRRNHKRGNGYSI